MTRQVTTSGYNSRVAPFKTKTQYIQSNPAITKGGLDWAIHHQRQRLLEEQAIAYFGRKILIHEKNLNRYILEGGTRVIGGAI